MSQTETTIFDLPAERSFRVQRADGTVEEYISSGHYAKYDEDVDAVRAALGWVDAEGTYVPPASGNVGKVGRPYRVVSALSGSHVASYATQDEADAACAEASAAARSDGYDDGDDPYKVVIDYTENAEVA